MLNPEGEKRRAKNAPNSVMCSNKPALKDNGCGVGVLVVVLQEVAQVVFVYLRAMAEERAKRRHVLVQRLESLAERLLQLAHLRGSLEIGD